MTGRIFLVAMGVMGFLACSQPNVDGSQTPKVVTVVGRLGAPPEEGSTRGALTLASPRISALVGSSMQATSALAVEDVVLIFEPEDGGEPVEASPGADGQVAVELPTGTYRVTIEQDPLSPVAYQTETTIEATEEGGSFFLPRVSLYSLPKTAKVDACGKKVAIDETTGRFVLGSHMGLVVGDLRDPGFAALLYDERSFAFAPALLAITDGGERALAMMPDGIRIYDIAGLESGAVVDCSNQDCFAKRELPNAPEFPVYHEECWQSDRPDLDPTYGPPDGGIDPKEGPEPEAGFSEIDELGGFGGDYSVFHDDTNQVFIVQIGDWTAFIDDQTAEVKRVIAEGGRFQGKHGACDRYVFSYPHDNDLMIRIVNAELQITQEFDLKENGIVPTVEEVFNGADDPATDNFLLSLGVLNTDNSVIGALLTLDTCAEARTDDRSWPPQVVDVKTARDAFDTSGDLHAGPIDIALDRFIIADSVFERTPEGAATPIVINTRSAVDLSALSADTNPFVTVDARASTYFLFGSPVENAGMAFVHIEESGELLPFVLRLGTEATRHIEVSEAAGAVIGITADGRVYWVLYSAALQPEDQINHRSLGESTYAAYHPRCDNSTPCPDNGVCVAENDFANASGECRPQPPGEATMWCGGLTDVECDPGYECAEMDYEPVAICVPRTSCDAEHPCAEGFLCTQDATFFGMGQNECRKEGDEEICCWPINASQWECCGMHGCETVPQPDWITNGPQCVKSNGEYCGGLHDLACEPDEQGTSSECLRDLMDMPPDVGLCAKQQGDPCHRSDQCAGDLVCNAATGSCEPRCDASADCRVDGSNVSCVFHGGDVGRMCDPFAGLQCADDEVGVSWTGECYAGIPCDPWMSGELSQCSDGTACIESPDHSGVGSCLAECQTTADCQVDEVCAVDPWSGHATLVCVPTGNEFVCASCAGDQWCSIPERSCRNGRFCNESHPCPADYACQYDSPDRNNICGLLCQANSDCDGDAICMSGHDGQRVCAVPDPQHFPSEVPNCQGDEYLQWTHGEPGCFLAVNEPCSDGNNACPENMTCNFERGVCLEACDASSDCTDAAEQCVAIESQWHDGSIDRYCRPPRAGQLVCASDYFVFRGACAKLPSTTCGGGVGCPGGHECLDQVNDSGLCICSALDACTSCAIDAECPNGAACTDNACEWVACVDGQCSTGETCVGWASQGTDSWDPWGDPNQPIVIYPPDPVCMAPGSGTVGDGCNRIEDCSTLACAHGSCVDLCASTGDCPDTMGCVATDPWDWNAPRFNYCAEYACDDSCAAEEVCWPWANDGQGMCSPYLPCGSGDNDGCEEGFLCDHSDGGTWGPSCKPLCQTTADCTLTSETCAALKYPPQELQGSRICGVLEQDAHCVDSEWAIWAWVDSTERWVCTAGSECSHDGNSCPAPTDCIWSGEQDVCACVGSICDQTCADDSECNNGHPTLMCMDGACRARPGCQVEADCPATTVCGLIDAHEEMGPRCVPPGPQAPGDSCSAHADCDSGICAESVCATRCETSGDCDPDHVCAAVPVMPEDEWVVGICLADSEAPECSACGDGDACNLTGECGAGPLCNDDSACGEGGACVDNLCRVVCARGSDCASGEDCASSSPDSPFVCVDDSLACQGSCGTAEVCLGGICQASNPCGQDIDCYDGACVAGQCREHCSATSQCAAGFECVALGGTSSDSGSDQLRRVCWLPQCDCLDAGTWCWMRDSDGDTAQPTCYLGNDCTTCDGGSPLSWCDWDVWRVDGLSNACQCNALEICGPSCTSHADCPTDRVCDSSSACVTMECTTASDCPTDTVCGGHPGDWNLRSCRVPGDVADGGTCYDHSNCASGYCDDGTCKTPCDVTAECNLDSVCQRSSTGAAVGTCVAEADSSCASGCAAEDWCYTDGQCHTGTACFQWWDACGSDAHCDGVACRLSCDTTVDCGSDEVCVFGVDGMPGDVATCAAATDTDCTSGCADDEWCFRAYGQPGQCYSGVPCHSGQWESCIQGEWCDEVACRLDCDRTDDCPAGEVCTYDRPGVPWGEAACIPAELSACGAGCADTEWCYNQSGECHAGTACYFDSEACAQEEVCDGTACLPQCATTAECLVGEVCTHNPPFGPGGVALCIAEEDSPCSSGCAADAWCFDDGWSADCFTGSACYSGGQGDCSGDQHCDGRTCLDTCNATSDCSQGKECVLREDIAGWPLNGVTSTKLCMEPRCNCHDASDVCWVRGDFETSTDLACYRAQSCSIFTSCSAQGLDAYACDTDFGACMCDDPAVCGQSCDLHADCTAGTVCDETDFVCIESECRRASECAAAHSSEEMGNAVCAYSGDTSGPRTCTAEGEVAVGSPCNDWRECQSGMCFANVCVVPCVDNSECTTGSCQAFADSPFPICVNPGNPVCSDCTGADEFCDGTGACQVGPACSFDGDCPNDEHCEMSTHTCML
jgi:hypothetical protein